MLIITDSELSLVCSSLLISVVRENSCSRCE